MKKVLIAITALVYFTVSTGATVNLHYCMGKLMSWDFSAKSDGKCGTCGMQKAGHKGCCSDEQKTFKVDKDQQISESNFQFLSVSTIAITVTYTELPFIYPSNLAVDYPTTHAPPDVGKLPLFVLNRNFRI